MGVDCPGSWTGARAWWTGPREPLEQTRRGVTTQELPGLCLLLEQHGHRYDVPYPSGKLRVIRRVTHHRQACMQA